MNGNKGKIELGVLIEPFFRPEELVEIAKRAEGLGYASIWYPDEKFYREPYVGLTLIALHTHSVNLGVCVTDPYSRHPIMTAAAIGSVAEIAPNRTWLGIGAGGRGFAAMGIQRDHPATAIREAVLIIRRLLAGEEVAYKGKVISLNERRLDFQPPMSIPIMIATGYGRKIQELAGEIGDAVMLANYATPETIRPALLRVEEGARRAGRSFQDFRLISRVDVAVHENGVNARSVVAPAILSAIRASYPSLDYLEELPEFVLSSKLLDVIRRKDYRTRTFYSRPENCAHLIPYELTKNMSVAGSPSEVRDQLSDIVKMNIFDEITVRPVPCRDQTMIEAITWIREIFDEVA